MNKVFHGNNLEILKTLPDNSVDSVCTDPPYGLGKEPDALSMLRDWITTGHHEVKGRGFMGKEWDKFVPQPVLWKEVYRVMKPGAHLLTFFGDRTYDIGTLAVRLAGFEIRGQIDWVYGQGFPKSMDISKAIDKAAGAAREVIGKATGRAGSPRPDFRGGKHHAAAEIPNADFSQITEPSTDDAKTWEGWGTALKPALEPICFARKPLDGTVVSNVLKHGTGGINIDGCRIPVDGDDKGGHGAGGLLSHQRDGKSYPNSGSLAVGTTDLGRWPSNFIHDGSEEVLAGFPTVSSGQPCGIKAGVQKNCFGKLAGGIPVTGFGDSGSAARFFYVAKCSPEERGDSKHPTIKPLALMRYLVRLITPPGGVVLDMYAGTGTTGQAALMEGMRYILIEEDPASIPDIEKRMKGTQIGMSL